MQILIHQQVNIIAAIVLLLFLAYARSVLDRESNINKIYLVSLSLNLLLTALDIVFNSINRMESVAVVFPRVIGGLMVMLSPILSYLFLKFVCFYFPNPIKIKKSTKAVFTVLIIINSFVAIFFYKSKIFSGNIRATDFLLPFLISVFFLVYSILVVVYRKKMLIKFEFVYIISVSLITSLLVITLLFTNETRFICCSSTFTLILMFIVIQQREMYRDSLTGARNRLVLKKCLDAQARKPVNNLSVVMIDLDYFKNINDSYGHSEGDYALKIFVRLLQKVYSDNCIVIRMGGDEFMVLIYEISSSEVDKLIMKMSKIVDRYNKRSNKPYRIKYSCASGTYNNCDVNIDEFVHDIDMKMYQNKKGAKGYKIESVK